MNRPIHVMPSGPRSGFDHRTGVSRCPCDPVAGMVINEPAVLVWIHRPRHEPSQPKKETP